MLISILNSTLPCDKSVLRLLLSKSEKLPNFLILASEATSTLNHESSTMVVERTGSMAT